MSLLDGPGSKRSQGMVLRSGVHKEMEDAADEILRRSIAGITKHSEKSDILTPWKEHARRSREVMVPSGVPDAAVRRGSFHRSANLGAPHLNSIEGVGGTRNTRPRTPWDSE